MCSPLVCRLIILWILKSNNWKTHNNGKEENWNPFILNYKENYLVLVVSRWTYYFRGSMPLSSSNLFEKKQKYIDYVSSSLVDFIKLPEYFKKKKDIYIYNKKKVKMNFL